MINKLGEINNESLKTSKNNIHPMINQKQNQQIIQQYMKQQ